MSAPERDLLSFDDIPDPAAAVARRDAPVATPPTERSLTRAERRSRLVLGLVIALVWVVAFTLRSGLRTDLSLMVVGELAIWVATGAGALAIALHPGARGLSLGVRVLAVVLWSVPAIFVASALAWSLDASPFTLTWANARACLGLCTVLGAGPLFLACVLFRRAFAVMAPWRLALLGAVCGLSGSIGCQAHCPIGAASHVLVAHGLPIVIGALIGAAYGALRGRT